MSSAPRSPPPPSPREAPAPAEPRPALIAALIGVLGAAAFASALGGGFIHDDRLLIADNPFVHSFAHAARWFTTDFWDYSDGMNPATRLVYYRPLVTASYALDWALGRGSPLVFHVTNLAWHAAASALAYLALRRWTGAWRPAALVALLLAVHPTRAESVAWISGRTDPMCATFLLLASAGIARRLRGARGGRALEIVGVAGAFLTKELAIVLPALVAVEVWVHAGRPPLDRALARRVARAAAPELALAAGYLALRHFVLPIGAYAGVSAVLARLTTHATLVLETFGYALERIVAPRELTIDHAPIRIVEGRYLASVPHAALGALLLAALAALAARLHRRRPGVALGLALFFVAFVPTSNLMLTRLTSLTCDRFLYLPLLGVALSLASLGPQVSARWGRGLVGLGVAAGVLAAGASVARAREFGDERRFWEAELSRNPDSLIANATQIRFAMEARDFGGAFEAALETYRLAKRYYGESGYELFHALEAVQALALLTPDRDEARLRALAELYAALLDDSAKRARLVLPELRFELDSAEPRLALRRREVRPRLQISEAELRSRLGDDARATRLAHEAAQACRTCTKIWLSATTILARAGDYSGAERLASSLDGADALEARARLERARGWHERARAPGVAGAVARAQELSGLGAYGRALAALDPFARELLAEPGGAVGYAELAWRAGDFPASRRALAEHGLTAPERAALERAWSKPMGWEPPRPR